MFITPEAAINLRGFIAGNQRRMGIANHLLLAVSALIVQIAAIDRVYQPAPRGRGGDPFAVLPIEKAHDITQRAIQTKPFKKGTNHGGGLTIDRVAILTAPVAVGSASGGRVGELTLAGVALADAIAVAKRRV